MTLSARMEVLITIAETGVLPLFHTDDADRAGRITGALREGGARAIEFTDRGPGAWSVFSTLTASAARHDADALLGAGSIRDAYAADRFIAAGARFIVGPSFNAEVARVRDMVSDPVLGEIRIQWWRDALKGQGGGHPTATANSRAASGARPSTIA